MGSSSLQSVALPLAAKKAKILPPERFTASPPPAYVDLEAGPSTPLRPLISRTHPNFQEPAQQAPFLVPTPVAPSKKKIGRAWKITIPLGCLIGLGAGGYFGYKAHAKNSGNSSETAPVIPAATVPLLSGNYLLKGTSNLPSSNCSSFAKCITPFELMLSFTQVASGLEVTAAVSHHSGPVDVSQGNKTYDFVWSNLQDTYSDCHETQVATLHLERQANGAFKGTNNDLIRLNEDCGALSGKQGDSCVCDSAVTLSPV